MNEPTPMHVGDALDWLHEEGKRRARTVPEFDLEATLRKLRAVRDADAYALSHSEVLITAQEAVADVQAHTAALERRLHELNQSPEGWQRFRKDPPSSPPPPSAPISFDRTEVLYEFSGSRGLQATSHRWLRAHESVDHYDAVGWYYNEPGAPVEILPLANCAIEGPMHELPRGGVLGRLKFSHMLAPGERYYFAYITRFNSDQPCMPAILDEVRELETRDLTVRVQFDSQVLPQRICYFNLGAQDQDWEWPEEEAPEWLDIAPNGFVEYRFQVCQRGRHYGLKWEWPPE